MLRAEMSQMLKSSGAMGAATLISRILGFLRETVYASFMGDTAVASAFKFAFMIPNLFRRLLGEGALSAAFIPIFKEKEKLEGEASMWKAANAVLSGLLAASVALTVVVVLGVSFLLSFTTMIGLESAGLHLPFGRGIVLQPETLLTLRLLRVMFPYTVMICATGVLFGMLNARGYFFIPASGAIVMNVIMIASVYLLAPRMGFSLRQQIFGLAIGALAAGLAQMAFQWFALRREGFVFRWVSPWRNPTVREVARKMVPGMMGVAAFQLNVLVTGAATFFVDKRIYASFDYAVRLMELPQGMFGASLATYLLPTLSGLAAEKKYPEFRSTLRQGLGYLAFMNLIASILLVVLAEPIVRLLFEHGKFNADSTQRSSQALMMLAPGLIAFSFVNVLARAFYALGDTMTPMKISVCALVCNLVLGLAMVWNLRQAGLGLANTMSATINAGLLLFALKKKLKTLDFSEFRKMLPLLLTCGCLAVVLAYGGHFWWERTWGHAKFLSRLGAVAFPALLSGAGYFFGALWLRIDAARDVAALFRRRFKRATP